MQLTGARSLVVAGGALAFGWYCALLLARDAGLSSFGYDQAFFQQLIFNLDRGAGLVSSFVPGSFLGLHFEPLLLVPALFELAWPDPRLLSVVAALSIAALGPAAFLFLQGLTGRPGLAASIAAPVPFWPALQEASRAGFHPEYLGAGLALCAGSAALAGRRVPALVLAVLALGAKEDQAYSLLVIGAAVATVPAARRLGLGLAGLGLAWGLVVVGLVMPLVRAGRHLDTDSYYAWLGSASPAGLAHALTAPGGWGAALVMVLCAAGLPLLRPGWLLPAAPPLVADLLSAHDPQPLLHLQYALPLLVPVLVAAGMAAPVVARLRPVVLLAAPPALAALLLGTIPPAFSSSPAPFRQPAALTRLAGCVRTVPSGAAVAADDTLLAHLAWRPVIRELGGAQPGDHLVADRLALQPGYVSQAERDRVLAAGGRRVLCDDGRFLVMAPAPPAGVT